MAFPPFFYIPFAYLLFAPAVIILCFPSLSLMYLKRVQFDGRLVPFVVTTFPQGACTL